MKCSLCGKKISRRAAKGLAALYLRAHFDVDHDTYLSLTQAVVLHTAMKNGIVFKDVREVFEYLLAMYSAQIMGER